MGNVLECAPKGVITELNLIGTLAMRKTMGMAPNFSELAHAFGKGRHSIKALHEANERPLGKRPSSSDGLEVERGQKNGPLFENINHPS